MIGEPTLMKEYSGVKEMQDFITEAAQLIPQENAKESYESVVKSSKEAERDMADNEEKKAWLTFVLCNTASRVMFYLFSHNIETPEDLTTRFRNIQLPENALDYARTFGEKDNEADMELVKKHQEIEKRRKGIDIFKSILSGRTLEEAKQDMAEYDERQKQAMEQMAKQGAAQL